MKKVVGQKLYNTDTAALLHEWDNGAGFTDFSYRSKDLYVTPKGAFFIHHHGGETSDMSRPVGNRGWVGGEDIMPITRREAIRFLELYGGTEVLLQRFPEDITEG